MKLSERIIKEYNVTVSKKALENNADYSIELIDKEGQSTLGIQTRKIFKGVVFGSYIDNVIKEEVEAGEFVYEKDESTNELVYKLNIPAVGSVEYFYINSGKTRVQLFVFEDEDPCMEIYEEMKKLGIENDQCIPE